MLFIEHRKNTIEELEKVPVEHGVEIDLRSSGDRIILHHDPFQEGTDFETWLAHYRHTFLILNTKEEGLESRIQALLKQKGITEYFFLDVSFPFIVKLMRAGESKIAIRFSEYESIETCLALKDSIDWIWVDCFSRLPLDKASYKALSGFYKFCLVSPELVGREEDIPDMKKQVRDMKIDAVCTKKPDLWM